MDPDEDRVLAVFGATGKTGLALVAEARWRGWWASIPEPGRARNIAAT
jgi:hypothetical protein